MKKNRILWAVLPMMAAALMTTSCSNEGNIIESVAQQNAVKTIPYTVTVNEGSTTRATVGDDNKTFSFAVGDKLYVSGTNIQGVLTIESGAGTASATFSGSLTYSGSGTPASDLALTATLVSAQQTVGNRVTVSDAGAVTVNYPTTSYCISVSEAVQRYSNLTGSSTYGEKSFSLSQQTAFLFFDIFVRGIIGGSFISANVINNGSSIANGDVTTWSDEGRIKATFVLPVASGTVLNNATLKCEDVEVSSPISDATLAAKVYTVRRTVVLADLITIDDIEKEEDENWGDICDKNQEKIHYPEGRVLRKADNATLLYYDVEAEEWKPVENSHNYHSSLNYKFEFD